MGRRPDELRLALESLLRPGGRGDSTSPWSATRGSRGAAGGRARRRTRPRTSASRRGATSACRQVAGRAAVLPRRRRERWSAPDALARVARRFADDPALGLLQLRVEPRGGGASRARLGAAAAGRRPGAVERHHRGVGGRGGDAALGVRGGRRLAGGLPLRPRGDRPRVAGDGRRPPGRLRRRDRRPASVADRTPHGYSFYYGARNRVWLARRHLPLPLAVVYLANFVLRTLPRLRSARRRARRAARLPRRAARGRAASASR